MAQRVRKYRNIFIEVQLGVLVYQDAPFYIAFCPALQLSTYGNSIVDVKVAFDDLIKNYLEDAVKSGTFADDLAAHGWELQMSEGKVSMPKEVELNIPAGMLLQHYNEPFRIPIPIC